MISKRMKAIAGFTAAAIALTSAGSVPAFAGQIPANFASVNVASQVKAATQQQATEFSSRNRYYHGHNNNAAVAAMAGVIISGIAAYAAAREYRKARERENVYYGPGPYNPQSYYGPRPYY